MEKEVERHNKAVLESLEKGDLVEINRGMYSHWGVSMGDETIVHLTGVNVAGTAVDSSLSNVLTYGSGMDATYVKREKVLDVAGNCRMKKNNNKDGIRPPFSGEEIKERARLSVSPTSYSLFWDNCEHFAAWCRNGISRSNQADTGYFCSVALGVAVTGTLACKRVGLIAGAFTDVGRWLCYAALPGGNDIGVMYEIKQNVGLEWPFPGDEMMRKVMSDLYSQYYHVVVHYSDKFVNVIPVFQVNTALVVAGSVVAVVVAAWAAYKLYVHREKLARGIKNCCSSVANGISSLFGKLFSW